MIPPGTTLGRYTIRKRLGAGGMGDVYLGVDPQLGREVAVKVLPEALASDADRLARFVREARTVSALNHPNLLTVFDFGQEGAIPFLVTELVEGRTLREWNAEGRPPLADLLDVIGQAALALAAAHASGVIHRDIKPENLMRRSDGFVKVLDFGIAKLVAGAGAGPSVEGSTDPQLETRPGTILGTVRYMSPEQALGTAVDARSDVWSLGVVLYEFVAGKPPFAGLTPMGTLSMIIGREPEPLEVAAPGTPEDVCRIVARALRKEPEDRFGTAAEMAGDLARAAAAIRSVSSHDAHAREAETLSLDAAAASGSRPASTPTNLPPRVSALVGRERELGELTALLREPDVRLVTITGAGGTGKTRLAVEAGREVHGEFADGVFAVDLSTLSDPGLLASRIAAVLGLRESAESTLEAEVDRFLAGKRMLLVLDNFEQLLAGAPFVSGLLAAAIGLRILVTSQALLHLAQEVEYALEPLAVPDFASLPPLEELSGAPAVALFVERARAARPSFALTADNARTIVEICRRLDGLPLALELAAARVKLLSPQAMLERLDNTLKFLTGGARDLPSRQQTMRGAVAWSYDLLDESERAVLRRLAVFADGCMLDAAEAVCASDEFDVLDALGSLVDKSLVRQRELEDGEVRFTMLEVVRAFALEQFVAGGEADAVRLEHARYFRRVAREAALELGSADQIAWVARLRREYDNFVAAIAVLIDREPSEGVAFVLSMSTFCNLAGLHSQKRAWMLRALETGPASDLQAKLLHALGHSELFLGNVREAASYSRQAVDALRAFGDPRTLALALNGLGQARLRCDDPGGAREAHEEGLAIAREIGDRPLVSIFLISRGEVARSTGDLGAARADYEEALEEEGRHRRSLSTAVAVLNLGGVSFEQGDVAAAAGFYSESLSIGAEFGDPSLCADAIDGLAAVAVEAGNREKAARLAGAAEALYEQIRTARGPFETTLRDRYVARLRADLEAYALEREWVRGRAMTLEAAVAEALQPD